MGESVIPVSDFQTDRCRSQPAFQSYSKSPKSDKKLNYFEICKLVVNYQKPFPFLLSLEKVGLIIEYGDKVREKVLYV